jgi:uncharacterized membrane protein YqaE (UPF0057 family)
MILRAIFAVILAVYVGVYLKVGLGARETWHGFSPAMLLSVGQRAETDGRAM